jgi:hypothetical protein
VNHYTARAKAHHDVSLLRRKQVATARKKADAAFTQARIARAGVATAQSQFYAFQRLSEAYDAKARECDHLREGIRLACKVGDNMGHAYDLILKELRASHP